MNTIFKKFLVTVLVTTLALTTAFSLSNTTVKAARASKKTTQNAKKTPAKTKKATKKADSKKFSKKTLIGTWKSKDGNFIMVLSKNGKVYVKGNGSKKFEDVGHTSGWKMKSAKNITITDIVYGMGESKYIYKNKKLMPASNKSYYYKKISSKTKIK